MPRLPHHSSNYGGARPGSGRPKGTVTRLTERALEMAEKSKIHPFEYLLSIVSNKHAPQKDRINAAQAALPYCLTRLSSAEVNVNHALSDESEQALVNRLLSAQNQLVQLGMSVIESQAVNE